jgi:dTDP-4-dehydrorhamnose 3,5-epimerase
MQFIETPLKGAYQIVLESKEDARGAFCRLFCRNFFIENGIDPPEQINLSDNRYRATLRGLHYQGDPYQEGKIVYCLKGKVFDVIVDLRPSSSTFTQYFSLELGGPAALFIPKGFAHGFITLEPNSQLLYLMTESYRPGYERGYRYDDPVFNIKWPMKPKVISERDKNLPTFEFAHA